MRGQICQECRREFGPEEKRIYYGKKIVCETCLHQLARQGNICPLCGCPITDPKEGGVTLTVGRKSQACRNLKDQNRVEPEVQIIVCPGCHVLFVDGFNYQVIRGMGRVVR